MSERFSEEELNAIEEQFAPMAAKFYREASWYAVRLVAALRVEREALGDALMYVRLALVSVELLDSGFSDDRDEPQRILSALCERLVAVGAVDPMEAD